MAKSVNRGAAVRELDGGPARLWGWSGTDRAGGAGRRHVTRGLLRRVERPDLGEQPQRVGAALPFRVGRPQLDHLDVVLEEGALLLRLRLPEQLSDALPGFDEAARGLGRLGQGRLPFRQPLQLAPEFGPLPLQPRQLFLNALDPFLPQEFECPEQVLDLGLHGAQPVAGVLGLGLQPPGLPVHAA
ncbi:MAG: hypothetical protein L0Z62_38055 [Gemmataceae bacterium]|nr:hypothetical protein [Gemmataceae bacterium]